MEVSQLSLWGPQFTKRVSSRAERGTSQKHAGPLAALYVTCVSSCVFVRSLVVCATRDDRRENARQSPCFRVRFLLDLLKARVGAGNPITRFVDFSRIHWNRSRNRLCACHQLPFKLDRFRAFDLKLPVMPEFVERVKHRLCLNGVHPAATHGVVEHAVAI